LSKIKVGKRTCEYCYGKDACDKWLASKEGECKPCERFDFYDFDDKHKRFCYNIDICNALIGEEFITAAIFEDNFADRLEEIISEMRDEVRDKMRGC